MRPQGSPKRAPEYNLIRFVTAVDAPAAGPPAGYRTKGAGCNFGDFMNGNIQVVPVNTNDAKLLTEPLGDLVTGATSAPAITVRYWNEDLQMYLPHNPAQTLAALGAGVGWESTLLNLNGRLVFFEVTAGVTAGQGVLIFASGALHHESI